MAGRREEGGVPSGLVEDLMTEILIVGLYIDYVVIVHQDNHLYHSISRTLIVVQVRRQWFAHAALCHLQHLRG